LTATGGSIAGTSKVSAAALDLDAKNGINNGSGGGLAVAATSISADNTGAALVSLSDTQAASTTVTSFTTVGGDLTYNQTGGGTVQFTGNVTSGSGAVNGGNITITVSDGLTIVSTPGATLSSQSGSGGILMVGGAVTLHRTALLGQGNITLNGGGGATADIIIDAAQSSTQTITLTANRDIIIGAMVQTTTASADILLTADTDNNGVGGVRILPAGQISAGRNATLQGSDLFVTSGSPPDSVRVDSDGSNDQVVAAGNVTISNGAAAPAGARTFLNGVVRSSGSGIVSISALSAIELSSTLSSVGGAIQLNSPVVLTGNVTLSSGGGAITFASTTNADLATNNRSLALSAGAGDITFTGAVGASQALQSIAITNAKAVTFGGTVTTNSFVTQGAGTGLTTFNGGNIGGSLNITTDAITLAGAALTATGPVSLQAQNAVTVNVSLDAGASTIAIAANQDGSGSAGFTQSAASTINTTNTTAGALSINVNTATGSGGATLGLLNAGANATITVNTHGGAIFDNNGATQNVTFPGSSGTLKLTATGGIGSSDALETQVSALQATNTGGGNIQLTNTGALSLTSVSNTGGGNIGVSNVGNTTAGSISASGGTAAISITSTGTFTLPGTGTLSASGNISLQGTSVVTISGAITAAATSVQGSANNDQFFINSSPANGMAVDGLNGSDTYTVPNLALLSGSVNISDTGATGTDVLSATATAFADTLTITATAVIRNGISVGYTGLESVTVDAGDGDDIINVQGTASTTPVIVLGGLGNDTFIVSSNISGAGDLSQLRSPLAIDAGAGSNVLYVSEATSAVGDNVSVSASQLHGTAVPFTINYTATGGSFGVLTLLTGTGNDVVNVSSLPGGSNTTILTGGGNDTINVPVSSLVSYNFTVNGGAPTGGAVGDVLNVTDISGAAVIHNLVSSPGNGTVEVLYLNGAPSHITYQDIEQVVTNPTADQSFLQSLARATLGRNLSPTEVAVWTPYVTAPGYGRAYVANVFVHSQEAIQLVVQGWFPRYLGRQPAPGEINAWVNLLVQGQTEEQVLNTFFQTYYAGLQNTSFVVNAYARLLGRSPSPGELTTTVGSMLPLVGRAGILSLLLGSGEFRSSFITTSFVTWIRRPPTTQELNTLVNSPYDLTTLRVILLASDQFFLGGL
jgi:hypothetical protein